MRRGLGQSVLHQNANDNEPKDSEKEVKERELQSSDREPKLNEKQQMPKEWKKASRQTNCMEKQPGGVLGTKAGVVSGEWNTTRRHTGNQGRCSQREMENNPVVCAGFSPKGGCKTTV